MYNFWVGMGNCFAKNKLPGCFKLKRRPRDSIFYQRNPIFSHYVNLVALISQSPIGASWPWLRGQGPGAGFALLLLAGVGSWRGLSGRGHPHLHPMHASGPPPRGLHFHGKGTPRGSGGRGPHPGCSKVGQLLVGAPGEVEGLDHIDLFPFTFYFFFPHPS